MTKKTKKQLFAALTALIICICTLSPLAALASNDYLAYSFKIAATNNGHIGTEMNCVQQKTQRMLGKLI